MGYLAGKTAFFCEVFWPDTPTGLDTELDAAVSTQALASGTMSGFCNLAAQPALFAVTDSNLRENVISNLNGSSNRHRMLACSLGLALFEDPLVTLPDTIDLINSKKKSLFLTETTTPFHHAVKALIDSSLLVTSEYFGDQYASGDSIDGVRHEDLQKTSFPSNYFDVIITSDVMEHVPDALMAERDIVRILKPGGAYCFTAPLLAMADEDLILARMRADGTIDYLDTPIYHGDPLRAEGALVYRIFSIRQMTERFRQLGATCTSYRLWSKGYGLIGPGCFVHVVRKNAANSI